MAYMAKIIYCYNEWLVNQRNWKGKTLLLTVPLVAICAQKSNLKKIHKGTLFAAAL